jgi:hypothetical protein
MAKFSLVVVLFSTMGRFKKAIAGAVKKIAGSSSKRSCGSSSSRYTEHEESPMHEDEETVPTEEQEEEQVQEQGQSMEDNDASHLDLERGQEMETYNLIKNREFDHTPLYNPTLLQAIGMDVEFTSIWKAIGWEEVDPLWEQGSRLLTIQFLCSLKEVDNGITFRLFEEHFCTRKGLAQHIGFQRRCLIDIDHALRGFNHHNFGMKFWVKL